MRIPVRSTEPRESRHQINPSTVAYPVGKFLNLGRGFDNAKSVSQPLDRRPAHEDAPLERVLQRTLSDLPGNGGQQTIRAGNRILSRELKEKATRPIGAFDQAGLGAKLPEESRLLVTNSTCDRYGDAKMCGICDSQTATARSNAGEDGSGEIEEREQLRIPIPFADVHQHGAGGIADIGHVGGSAGQFINEPAVDGSRGKLSRFGPRLSVRNLLENPADLAG